MKWVLLMAWRDSRASRRRLAMFSLAIVLGVAALVAIGSFRQNLEEAIHVHSKQLLGADLSVSSRQPLTEEALRFLEGIGEERSREISFSSMIYVPATEDTRLVQVRGLKGEFPYYGRMETVPAGARERLAEGNYAIVEEALMVQFGLSVGDEVRLGTEAFEIAGALRRAPGEVAAVTMLAPRVYIPSDAVERTGLLQRGSIVRYRMYFRFAADADVREEVEVLTPRLRELRLGIDTVERRQEELGQTMDNIGAFLHLVGFIALLLGAIGVASAVHVYVKRKLSSVAVLRCLGASAWQAFAIYLVQGMALGALGAALGAAFGVGLQVFFPMAVRELLPFDIPFAVAWKPVAQGVAIGFSTCVFFALLPLLAMRRVSPLRALRRGAGFERERRHDPLRWVVCGAIAAAMTAFAVVETGSLRLGLGAAGGIAVAFAALAATAVAISWAARRFFPRNGPYVFRQGLANLYRPENRTILLMLSLGLGAFLILTLFLVRETLLRHVIVAGEEGRPTLALFDIQDDQREPIAETIAEMGLPVLQDVPIVTMRLSSVNGISTSQLLREPGRDTPDWVLRREYRSTYRGELVATERIIDGEWTSEVDPEFFGPVPVSIEKGLAEHLELRIGDRLVFDVQGLPVETRVGSIRQVDWQRVQPNFFVVFPLGVLEEAPKFHVLVTRTDSPEESAMLQRRVVQAFPNVSAIDLSMIIETVDSIMGRAAFAIRFMAMFTVFTGIVVLASAVATSRFQRIREIVLLRTLGASRAQLRAIVAIEYLLLGALAGLTGGILATGAAWALATYVFKTPFALPLAPVAVAMLLTAAVTLVTGLLSSRGVFSHPPLETLRAEQE